jgi:hypothetical protein
LSIKRVTYKGFILEKKIHEFFVSFIRSSTNILPEETLLNIGDAVVQVPGPGEAHLSLINSLPCNITFPVSNFLQPGCKT